MSEILQVAAQVPGSWLQGSGTLAASSKTRDLLETSMITGTLDIHLEPTGSSRTRLRPYSVEWWALAADYWRQRNGHVVSLVESLHPFSFPLIRLAYAVTQPGRTTVDDHWQHNPRHASAWFVSEYGTAPAQSIYRGGYRQHALSPVIHGRLRQFVDDLIGARVECLPRTIVHEPERVISTFFNWCMKREHGAIHLIGDYPGGRPLKTGEVRKIARQYGVLPEVVSLLDGDIICAFHLAYERGWNTWEEEQDFRHGFRSSRTICARTPAALAATDDSYLSTNSRGN